MKLLVGPSPAINDEHEVEADAEKKKKEEEEEEEKGEGDVLPGKGRLHGGEDGWRRPPRPKSCLGRKGGEKAMV